MLTLRVADEAVGVVKKKNFTKFLLLALLLPSKRITNQQSTTYQSLMRRGAGRKTKIDSEKMERSGASVSHW